MQASMKDVMIKANDIPRVDRMKRVIARLAVVVSLVFLLPAAALADEMLDNVRWLLSSPERLPLIVEKRRNEISFVGYG